MTVEHGAGTEQATRVDTADTAPVEDATAPKGPTRLPRRSWGGVFKRTSREFKEDNLTDWAAALTYYGILAIFPALIALISIARAGRPLGHAAADRQSRQGRPGPGQGHLHERDQRTCRRASGAAGVLFIVGIAGALWSASGYVAAFMRASNAIYDVEEGRPFWKTSRCASA